MRSLKIVASCLAGAGVVFGGYVAFRSASQDTPPLVVPKPKFSPVVSAQPVPSTPEADPAGPETPPPPFRDGEADGREIAASDGGRVGREDGPSEAREKPAAEPVIPSAPSAFQEELLAFAQRRDRDGGADLTLQMLDSPEAQEVFALAFKGATRAEAVRLWDIAAGTYVHTADLKPFEHKPWARALMEQKPWLRNTMEQMPRLREAVSGLLEEEQDPSKRFMLEGLLKR